MFTDACNEAAGGSFGYDWFYFNWSQDLPAAESFHINEKEVLAVVLAAQRWAGCWQKCLRRLFWLSASYNFHMTSKHISVILQQTVPPDCIFLVI